MMNLDFVAYMCTTVRFGASGSVETLNVRGLIVADQ